MASSRSAGRRGILAALALCAVGAGETRADEPLTNPMLGDPAAIEAGRKTYRQRCYICHLSEGGRGPSAAPTPTHEGRYHRLPISKIETTLRMSISCV